MNMSLNVHCWNICYEIDMVRWGTYHFAFAYWTKRWLLRSKFSISMYNVLFVHGDYSSSLEHSELSIGGVTIWRTFETVGHCFLMVNFVAWFAPFFTFFSFAFGFLCLSMQKSLVATYNSYKGSSQWGLECIENHSLVRKSLTTTHQQTYLLQLGQYSRTHQWMHLTKV